MAISTQRWHTLLVVCLIWYMTGRPAKQEINETHSVAPPEWTEVLQPYDKGF